jgi:putative nucleotidyltransferase with HDIG domain
MNYALLIMNYFVSLQQICEKVLMKLYTDEELAEILDQELFHQISEAADRLGVECYVVGGYVRDIFLERPSNDIDVVVVGSGISVAQELKRMLGRKAHLSVFKNFGTAQVKIRRQESGVRRQESGVRSQENTPATDSSLQGNLLTPDSCLLTPQFLEVEFVGARKESYSHDSRKPIVEDGTLEDDQNRRDFTINAMAICLNKARFGELVDPFNGLADLEDGIIATPLEPDITFSDDPLRMMRCVRFATQLNFQIEDETFVALERMAERIKIVSGERIKDELNKIIMAPHPSIGFEYLQRCGLLQIILPELSALDIVDQKNGRAHKNNFYHTLEVLENVVSSQESGVSSQESGVRRQESGVRSQENTPATDSSLQGNLQSPDSCLLSPNRNLWLRWAALLHDVGKTKSKRWDPATGWTFHNHNIIGAKMVPVIFRRLMLPLDMKMKYVQKLVDLHMRPIAIADDVVTDSAVRRLLNDAGEDIDDLMTLCEADITSKNEVRKKLFLENFRMVREKLTDLKEKDYVRLLQPVIDGNEIMELFHLKPSREVGVLKQYLKDAVLDNHVENEREPLMQLLMQKAKEMKLI